MKLVSLLNGNGKLSLRVDQLQQELSQTREIGHCVWSCFSDLWFCSSVGTREVGVELFYSLEIASVG